jgi:CRP/FNR family transcriptional regulator, cyclic AMP receptor protein
LGNKAVLQINNMDNRADPVSGIIHEAALFRYLSDNEIETLSPFLEYRMCKKGEVLFREGDPGDFICFISSGKIEITKKTVFKGKQVILAVLSKGSFVGERSIIDGKPRSATATALEASDVLILKSDLFEVLVEEHPHIGVKLLRSVVEIVNLRLNKAGDRIAAIVY